MSTGTSVWTVARCTVELRDEDVPEPGPGEALIEAEASLISSGTEMLVYRGECASEFEFALDRPGRAGAFPFPVKYGYQVVGRIAAVGEGAVFEPGQRVFARHPHQSRFVLPAGPGDDWMYPVPDDVPTRRATLANLYGVGLNAVLDHPVRPGDVVAVSGLGVVGYAIADLARRTAGGLLLVDPDPLRRKAAEVLGADHVVGPEDAAEAALALSRGRGLDLHFEASGAPAAVQAALGSLGLCGTLVVVSNFGLRPVPMQLSPEFHYQRLTIASSQAGTINPEIAPRWDRARRMEVVMRMLAASPPLEDSLLDVPLAHAASAYARIHDGLGGHLGAVLSYPNPAEGGA